MNQMEVLSLFQSKSKLWRMDYYLGTQMPYRSKHTLETNPPKGYNAFYINYVGKHSARTSIYSTSLQQITNFLQYGYETQNLSLRGLELLCKIVGMNELDHILNRTISQPGKRMLEGIANRMIQRYPTVFGHKIIGEASDSRVSREGIKVFCDELQNYIRKEHISIINHDGENPYFDFYKINDAYNEYLRNGEWIPAFDHFVKREDHVNPILRRIFIETEQDKLAASTKEIYQILVDLVQNYASDSNGTISLEYYFNPYDRQYFWENNNMLHYLVNGPTIFQHSLPVDIAFPMLMNMIETSDYAIESGDVSANIRIGDTKMILPFAGLLGIKYASEKTDQLCKTAVIWKDYEIASLAANIQWVFYASNIDLYSKERSISNKIYVKMLYNEQEVNFPFYCETAPYYDWKEVKAYYLLKLKQMNINLSENVYHSLKSYACVS